MADASLELALSIRVIYLRDFREMVVRQLITIPPGGLCGGPPKCDISVEHARVLFGEKMISTAIGHVLTGANQWQSNSSSVVSSSFLSDNSQLSPSSDKVFPPDLPYAPLPLLTARVRVKAKLLKVLRTQPNMPKSGTIFTVQQISKYFFQYILWKRDALFDSRDNKVCICENDPLGGVFGVKAFHRSQAIYLLRQQLLEVTNVDDADDDDD
jgi:hypothetical protein